MNTNSSTNSSTNSNFTCERACASAVPECLLLGAAPALAAVAVRLPGAARLIASDCSWPAKGFTTTALPPFTLFSTSCARTTVLLQYQK